MKLKLALQWFAHRSIIIVTALLVAVGALLIWFLVAGSSPTTANASIGIAAISIMLAAISSIANLLQAVEVQKQREGQERPYVIAYFDGTSDGLVFFVVENFGNSPALNVTVQFNPAPIDFAGRPLNRVSVFEKPISFLPPGKSLRQAVDVGHRFLAEGKPTVFVVSISYTSVQHDVYQESTEYDIVYLKQATLPRKSEAENLESISKKLDDLVSLLKSAQGMNSFLVETPSQYHDRLERELSQTDNEPSKKP